MGYHTSDLSRGSDSDCNYRSQIDKWQRMGNQKDTLVPGLYSASAKRFENGKPSMANNGMPFSVQQLMCIWRQMDVLTQFDDMTVSNHDRFVHVRGTVGFDHKTYLPFAAGFEFAHHCEISVENFYFDMNAEAWEDLEAVQRCLRKVSPSKTFYEEKKKLLMSASNAR